MNQNVSRGKKLAFAVAFAAANASVYAGSYDSYVDWQWKPVAVADTNAGSNVRYQLDFTVPVHGPWLTLPQPDSMTVTWITRIPCAGGIDYREKGTEAWTRRWPVRYGQIDYTSDIQSFNLTGLKPGTEYEYRLVSNLDHTRTAYHSVVCEGREIYSFRTVDPQRANYKVWMTADHHGSARLCLDPMVDRTDSADCDFYFWLGDNVEDGMYLDSRYWLTFGFLDDVTRKWGKRKPTVFLRGNHELNGRDAIRWGDYFPQPDGKTYQAFRQGPVLWIGLDTMDVSKTRVQTEQHRAYLVEQREWMRGLKQTELWKGAKFRVVMGHFAPFPGEGTDFVGGVFTEFLQDESSEGRIHVFLSGHHHQYWRFNPNSKEARIIPTAEQLAKKNWKYPAAYLGRKPMPDRFPFVNCFLDSNDVVTCEVSPEKLLFKAHSYETNCGALHDAFEVRSDGTVKDAADGVRAYPIPVSAPKSKK